MLKRAIPILFLSILLSGCSVYKIDSQDTTLDFYPPKPSTDKVVYLEKVEKPHEVIGIVTVTTERTRSFEEVVEKMTAEAAVLGGDAVTDVRSDSAQGTDIFVHYSAKVIIFK